MGKKWSCPACEYKSGRRFNIERNISRKHGNYEVPVLTEFQNTDFPHQAYSQDYSDPYFPHPRQDSIKDILEKKKADSFISSYKFENKILGIYEKFLDALKLPPSEEKNLIVPDLILQMERAVSSSPNPLRQDFFKLMTSSKTLIYPSPSHSVPIWHQEIAKLLDNQLLNHSGSSIESDPAVKANVSSDSHKRKLQVALQRFLDYRKESRKFDAKYSNLETTPKAEKLTQSNPI